MQNQKNKPSTDRQGTLREESRRVLPFFIEFVKFSTGFAAIVAAALLTLHFANAAMR